MHYIYIDEAGRGPIAGPIYVGLIFEQVDKKPTEKRLSEVEVLGRKISRKKGNLSPGKEQVAGKNLVVETKNIQQKIIDKTPRTLGDIAFPAKDSGLYDACADSKILSESERETLFEYITKEAGLSYAIGHSSATDIDKHGIVWALRQSIMRGMHEYFIGGRYSAKALQKFISDNFDDIILVVDGPTDFGLSSELGVNVIPVIDGDALIPMISAASILAKVARDAYMTKISKKYVDYGFEKHKGYGTKLHYESIVRNGLSKEHRSSFIHIGLGK